MALEPETVTAEAPPNHELTDFTRRLRIGAILTVPVVTLEMGGHLTGLADRVGGQTSSWIRFALATPVVLWIGWPFFQRGWNSIRTRRLNMFTLIAIGVGAAWIYSVVAGLASQLCPAGPRVRTEPADGRSRAAWAEPGPRRADSKILRQWN